MNARYLIVGAGNFGREIWGWLQAKPEWKLAGFLDDTLPTLPAPYSPVLGPIAGCSISRNDRFIVAIAEPAGRAKVINDLLLRGGWVETFVHPTAVVHPTAHLRAGTILCPGAVVSAQADVGIGCQVNLYAMVGHDVTLGACCTLSAHVDLCGGVRVGRNVFFGSGARVLPKVTIGARAKIGAGAVVIRNVPEGGTRYGPAARSL